MERDARTVTVDMDEYEDLMAKADQYEDLMERASIALAMYRDLQAAVRVWRRLREHQLHLVEQCEAIEATRDAVPVIQASMVTLADCIRDVDRILGRYQAADPAARGGGEGSEA